MGGVGGAAAAADRRPSRLQDRSAFWLTAVALTLVMAVGTAPAPLWPLYQAAGGLTTPTITVLAGAVVAGATISFLLLGHLSDRYGRTRVLAPFLLVSAAALVVMAAWPSVGGLGAGRVLTGLALGVTAPTATAYLIDLGIRVDSYRGRATTVATAANLGGLALGPVLAGASAQFLPFPLVLPHVVLAVLLGAAALGMAFAPETVPSRGAVRRGRFALLPASSLRFTGAALAGFVSFAVMGIFAALGGIVVRGELRVGSVLVWGLTTGLVFASSALAQLATGGWPGRRSYVVGAALLPLGLTLVVTSVADPRMPVYLAACTVTGAACGLLFRAGLVLTAGAAAPDSRAGVLAVHFAVAYLGMGLGAVSLAALETLVGTSTAFGVVAAVFCALVAAGFLALRVGPRGQLGTQARQP
jgi:MFS family permease